MSVCEGINMKIKKYRAVCLLTHDAALINSVV